MSPGDDVPHRVDFYHLAGSDVDSVLAGLLEKTLRRGLRAVVRVATPGRVDELNRYLWTWRRDSFLPHGAAADGRAGQQPVYLCCGDWNPAGATVLFLPDRTEEISPAGFSRCCLLFRGGDDEAVSLARAHWKRGRQQGWSMLYWQQGPDGWRQAAGN